MATWLQQFGNWNTNANASIFGGADAANVMHQASGFGKAMSGLGINAGSIGGIANTIGQIGTGLLAGQNQTGVGNALQTIGGLASNIPGVGGLIGAGVGVVGGLVNAAFGSHINKEFVSQTENQINQLGNRIFNGNTNADLLNDWNNYFEQSYVTKKEVGSDGWFSNKAKKKRNALNEAIDEANERQLLNYNIAVQNADQNTDLRILRGMQAYGGPINSFRKYYAEGGSLFDSPEFFTFEPQTYAKGGYLNQAKALIRQNEGWSAKPYTDSPKGRNWRSVGYGFNDSGFRDKYPEGISKHYEHGITKKQAEEELDYFLNKAEKQLKSIYGKQWNDFTDNQKAAILDTYYQRPASVGKSSKFYKAITAGEDASKYLGVAGFSKRNNIRQSVFGNYSDYAESENPSANSSSLQEVASVTPVVQGLDLEGITPTQAKALELNLTSPTYDLSMFNKPMTTQPQVETPTVGTVEDFLASYGEFKYDMFMENVNNSILNMNTFDFGGWVSHTHGSDFDYGLDFVAEGDSHEQNPFGGVMVGQDDEGTPNLVEEGEYIWNGDYVFSRRMKVPKKLREKYSLPEDATFADAVKRLTKESEERPLDNISRTTQDHILGELADSQEELRAAKAQKAMDKQIQLQDDFLTGVQFGLGGGIHIDPSKRGTFKAQASKMGMGVQEAASHILANKEDYSPAMVKKANFAKNFAHAFGGSLFDSPFGDTNTFDFGGDLKTRRNSIIRNSGVTEEQANAMLFRMLSKEDRERAVKERVFGSWSPSYNQRGEIIMPTSVTPNRENGNSQQIGKGKPSAQNKSKVSASSKNKQAQTGSIVPFAYDWYRNGSDGLGNPTGFTVGKNGLIDKKNGYTQEYRDLVGKLTADDIRKWATEHPDDSSLKSFLARGNKLEDLTTDQWRKGATDGKYGFMHHVAEQKLQESKAPTRGLDMPTGNIRWTEDPTKIGEGLTTLPKTDITSGNTEGSFEPRQTWTRYAPIAMNALFGLKEMLTPADYGNADMIIDAAYRAGQPVSVGTEYIGDYRKRDPFDERYLMNIINQRGAAANRNFMNLSGGNRAVAMSGILANDLTTQMSLAEAARQAYLANRADDAQVAEFNRGTNIFNAQAQNTRNLSLAHLNSQRQNAMLSGIAQGARLRQAIKDQRDAAISANLTAFTQGLGDLGKENGYYNMLGGLNDEGILKYFYGDNWRTKFNNTQEEG